MKNNHGNILRLTILAMFLCMASAPSLYALVTGPGSAWQYCRRITLSPVTSSADLQVKVTLASGQYTNMNSSGNDLRFYDPNNNSCNYWIETWNTSGASTIWVKVPVTGTTSLYMYYGNASATAVSNGATTFDFFDGFDGSGLAANWQQSTSNGTISVSGGQVTISCNNNSGSVSLSSPFTPTSSSFYLETKNKESAYYRNRFYAAASLFGANPLGFDDGYFFNGTTGAKTTAQVFWNGAFYTTVNANTDYLTRWMITDGSTYNWYTLTYSNNSIIDTRTATTTSTIRYITIGVTEASGTSTIVDWVRVRKYVATEPVSTIGSQVANVTARISSQTNIQCNGQTTGSATVTATGGSGVYTYSWNSSPGQTLPTAVNLPIGTYTVTVTENSINLSATATATITQPEVVTAALVSQTNASCFNDQSGSITLSGSGGTPPYTYSIHNGSPSSTYQSSNIFTGLGTGTYAIRVKDSNGCESKSVH